MAGTLYTDAVRQMIKTTNLPMDVATYKIMLVNASYSNVQSETTCSNLGTHELGELGAVSGYTRGFGNAGRKAVSLSLSVVTTVVRCIISANVVWTALGSATGGEVIAGAALIKEVTSDALSIPIAFWPISPTVATNGSDFTITVDATGNIKFNT